MTDVLRHLDDLDADALTTLLRSSDPTAPAVSAVRAEAIGTGQLGSVFRIHARYAEDADGPRTLILKLASTDAGSRAQGLALGAYVTEVRFYERIAPTLRIAVPRCHAAAVDPETGWFTLLFEDLAERAETGDVLRGGTVDQAALAVEALVGLQAPRWGDPELERETWLADDARTLGLFASFADQAEPFLERFGGFLDEDQTALIERAVPRVAEWAASWSGPRVVQHGDYRLDNMMLGVAPGAPPLTVVDWQTARLGPPMTDLSYYLGACLEPEARRANEDALIGEYHRRLVAAGVETFSLQQCWESYRQTVLYGLHLAVGMGVRVHRTERGDRMFAAAVQRYADLALEHGAREQLAR